MTQTQTQQLALQGGDADADNGGPIPEWGARQAKAGRRPMSAHVNGARRVSLLFEIKVA